MTDFGDISQHISGWWYFVQEPWHLPLLHTYKLDHPDGVSIAFTDSIPLAALFFKFLITLFLNAFPAHFHYFGWWVGFVFIAQAVAATFLIRALGAKSWFAMVIAVGFALTWPVLHARYHHSALMTQSIILFGLAFYWLGQKGNLDKSTSKRCIGRLERRCFDGSSLLFSDDGFVVHCFFGGSNSQKRNLGFYNFGDYCPFWYCWVH
ncbi:MAG: DUF6311 domain-containing protein [Burkholderiaceae bacterium]